ncbi:MAG: mechanosensitive ion channel family protein [Rhodocyclaceae bacterium]|nr:MAG: mechanosensitive ion channel family protein [Rhodocyclaceae bacterium]
MGLAFFDWIDQQPWVETIAGALIALVAAWLAHRSTRHLLMRLARPYATANAVLRQGDRPMAFVLPLLGLQLVWNAAPPGMHGIELIRHLNSLALIGAITWLGMACIRGVDEAVAAFNPINVEDNLRARRIHTQSRVISRMLMSLVMLMGTASILITFPGVRQLGMSLLASAGVAGLVAGIAARPVLGNLIAGLQIALTQPIRIDDVVIVQGEWGWIEEISSTYVVVRLWDERRLVVPLQWFIENPFQNWTRTTSRIIGTVFLWVDYRMPLEPLRVELERICRGAKEWDGRVCLLQVTDSTEHGMQLRALVSSSDSPRNWDLRCLVREGLVAFVQRSFPDYLPTLRATFSNGAPGSSPVAN